jgi:hypothetical protein
MSADPAALQLRLLQTVVEVAAEKNSTLVMPIPVELLRFFDRAAPADPSAPPAAEAPDRQAAAAPTAPAPARLAVPTVTIPAALRAGAAEAAPLNSAGAAPGAS